MRIPINSSPTTENIQVPQIPLSFQIQQGANGWSLYPDSSPPLDSLKQEKAVVAVASKIAGVAKSSVTNMKIQETGRRSLSFSKNSTTSVLITFDVTTTPDAVGEKTQQMAYDKIVNALKISVNNNEFSKNLHLLGITINVTKISFSEYTVYYPTAQPTTINNVLSSNGANNTNMFIAEIVGIGIAVLIAGGMFVLFLGLFFKLKSKKQNETQKELSMSDITRRNSETAMDVIPNPLRRITVDATPSE
jgi:hypothetical protein